MIPSSVTKHELLANPRTKFIYICYIQTGVFCIAMFDFWNVNPSTPWIFHDYHPLGCTFSSDLARSHTLSQGLRTGLVLAWHALPTWHAWHPSSWRVAPQWSCACLKYRCATGEIHGNPNGPLNRGSVYIVWNGARFSTPCLSVNCCNGM